VSTGKLSALQGRVLEALAGRLDPPWTLTGGGALVGVHLQHRETRDLDLFWHGLSELGQIPGQVIRELATAGLQAEVIRTDLAFCELRVTDGDAVVTVDLVADPVPTIEPPQIVQFKAAKIQIDTRHEILVNKLCALFGRSELRDLQDVHALLEAGQDLQRAVRDAPKKDGGFSPLTLAWLLRQFPVVKLARKLGFSELEADDMDRTRTELTARIVSLAAPDDDTTH